MEKKVKTSDNTLKYLAAALFAVGAVYFLPLFNGFAWDDISLISGNTALRNIGSPLSLFTQEYYQITREPSFRITPILIYAALFKTVGANPFYFHLSTLLIHLAAAAGVFMLALRIFGSPAGALAASLIFGLHPANSEVVLCPSFNKDLLAAAGVIWILAIRARNSYREKWGIPPYAATALLFMAALFSKETALVLLILVPAFDLLIKKDELPSPGAVRFYTLLAVAALFYLLVRFVLLAPPPGVSGYYFGGTLLTNIYTLPDVIVSYIKCFLLPWPLSVERLLPAATSFSMETALSWTALIALSVWAARAASKHKPLLFSLIWIAAGLLPVMNFIPFLNRSFWAERYMYLSSAGLALAAGYIAARLFTGGKLARGRMIFALSGILLLYAAADIARGLQWKNPETLYAADLKTSDKSYRLNCMYAQVLFEKQDYNGAVQRLVRAIQLEPTSPYRTNYIAYMNLSYIYLMAGQFDAASAVCQQGLGMLPDKNPGLLANFAAAKYNLGKYTEAAALYEEAYSKERSPSIAHNLSMCYQKLGRKDKAKEMETAASAGRDPNDKFFGILLFWGEI